MEIYSDFPERLYPKKVIFAGESHVPLTIRRIRPHKDGMLLAFEEITNPEQAGRYRNQVVFISKAVLPDLPAGEYYFHELIGVTVSDDAGKTMGTLTDILKTGANDVYVITGINGREILLPAISDVVLDVDLTRKTMHVHLISGLVDEEGSSSGKKNNLADQ
jgi:16S rRNA processing protein RimM